MIFFNGPYFKFQRSSYYILTVGVEIDESDRGQRIVPIGKLIFSDSDGIGRRIKVSVVEYDALTNNRGH